MGKETLAQKIFTKFGAIDSVAYIASLFIAGAKGVFRPIFTMMDKKQDPESKKYAATREGLTEVIAIPSYFVFEQVAKKLAPKFLSEDLVQYDPKDGNPVLKLTKDYRTQFDSIIKAQKTKSKELKKSKSAYEEIQIALNNIVKDAKLEKPVENLFKDYKSKLKIVNATTSFVGVGIATLIAIPALCNIVMPPVMKALKNHKKSKNINNTNPIKTESQVVTNLNPAPNVKPNNTNILNAYMAAKPNTGMKVGM